MTLTFPEITENQAELEKIKGAYALNMCTVSVSQIVDYNDEYILEQEYDMILNNLNLEQIPKDEALLDVLTQLLDTITFFRIYDKKKTMIEKKYQQKVKNAIWDAIPSFGTFIAGGNWYTAAIAIASNVGSGYMNYRRSKAENDLDFEEKTLELEITAIEQFNALRRELFTTAWRLADKYNYPDHYRLTERQIRQYNEILMDPDPVRKYNRLFSVRKNFIAYPPFWYQLANTANAVSRVDGEIFNDAYREQYKSVACAAYEYFLSFNTRFAILRDDELTSACAVEYFELLPENAIEKKTELLKIAERWSGNRNDILQICAVDYLTIHNYDEAQRIFSWLVNENYNTEVNAQLLSSIYAQRYFEAPSDSVIFDHRLLGLQHSEIGLFQLPILEDAGKDVTALWNDFVAGQRNELKTFYRTAFDLLFDRQSVALGRLLFNFDGMKEYSDQYYLKEQKDQRINEFLRVSANQLMFEEYLERMKLVNYPTSVIEKLNEMLNGLQIISGLSLSAPVHQLELDIQERADLFVKIQEVAAVSEISKETITDVFEAITFDSITARFHKQIAEQMDRLLDSIGDMKDVVAAEVQLERFYDKNGLSIAQRNQTEIQELPVQYFSIDPSNFGRVAISFDVENQKKDALLDYLRENLPKIVINDRKVKLYFRGEEAFNAYFQTPRNLLMHAQDKDALYEQALAVIDGQDLIDIDLIMTYRSVVPCFTHTVQSAVPYKNVKWNGEKRNLELGLIPFKNRNIDMLKLGRCIEDVAAMKSE